MLALLSCARCGFHVAEPDSHDSSTAVAASLGPAGSGSLRATTDGNATNVAIIVPLHPPKFGYGLDLLQSMVSCGQTSNFRFFFAFSNEADKQEFKALPDKPFEPSLLVLDERRIMPNNPVSTKKWLALHEVFTTELDIEYAIATDSDQLFQSAEDFRSYFAEWSQRKIVLGSFYGSRKFYPAMQDASCAAVGLEATPPHAMPYTWWSDAPVYERADFQDFFKRITWDAEHLDMAEVFDHTSYLCYKIHVQGWKLIDVTSMTGTCRPLEKLGSDSQDAVTAATGYRFLWSRNKNKHRLLQFHVDRPPFKSFVGCAANPPRRWADVAEGGGAAGLHGSVALAAPMDSAHGCKMALADVSDPSGTNLLVSVQENSSLWLHRQPRLFAFSSAGEGQKPSSVKEQCEAALLRPVPKAHLLTFSSEGPPHDSGRSSLEDEAVYRQALEPHVTSYVSWTPRALREAGAAEYVNEWPDAEEVPANPKTNKIGFFAWKPWILLHKLQELQEYSEADPEVVIYHDAYSSERHTNYIERPEYLARMSAFLLNGSRADVFMGIQKACPARHCKTLKQYCKGSVLRELGGGRPELYDFPVLIANYIVTRNTPAAKELLSDWLEAVSNHDWLSPVPEDADPHPDFEWHTAEQCLFSVIVAKRVLEGKLDPRYPGFDGFNKVHKGHALDCNVPVAIR